MSHFPVFGGPHNQVLQLAAPLRARGVQSTMLLPTESGSAARRLRQRGVEVVQVPLHRLRWSADPRDHVAVVRALMRDVVAIRKVIRDRNHDAVVLTGLANPHGALAARLERVAVIWQILDTRTPAPLRWALMPMVRRWSDAVMFNGDTLERLHAGRRPLAQPTTVFTCPVDTDHFQPVSASERAAIRAELGVPPEAPLIGTVANLNPMKGVEWFIRAAVLIYRERPDAWFLISGQSYPTHAEYSARLRRGMQESSVPAERWLTQSVPPDRVYPALDVKLITSVAASEGRTTTGPEAMACGIPVVATDVGAVSEVIKDGVTGILVPPSDAEALARATLDVLASPQLGARLGREGRRQAVKLYGLGPAARIYGDLLAQVGWR